MSGHVVLLGDSIFDNRAYTGGEPDVVGHLRSMLPKPWEASLCAIDGSRAADLKEQLQCIPPDASHIVISLGGNDALMNLDLLWRPVSSTTEALTLLGERVQRFESEYGAAIHDALVSERETAICTIYNGNLDPEEARPARIALMLFNDVILRVAFENGLSVIDLRSICTEAEDYANPIEPSGRGGMKIARAIARLVLSSGPDGELSRVLAD